MCPKHGTFKQNRKTHITLKCGCPECRKDLLKVNAAARIKKSSKEFTNKAQQIHNNKYDYSEVKYHRCNIKVDIICNKHGIFKQTPNDHLTGYGCPTCGVKSRTEKQTLSKEEFIRRAIQKHGDRFDYSNTEYVGTNKHIKIICKKHGEFIQTPKQHLKGKTGGCLRCSGLSKNTTCFIGEAKQIHGERYDYSLTKYQNAKSKVIITCKDHGTFNQTPNIHLSGSGCPNVPYNNTPKKQLGG